MDYKQKLLSRNNKPISQGELVIMAKVLSDNIKIREMSDFDIKQYMLLYKGSIINYIYELNRYTYIPSDQCNKLLSMVESFVNWRYNVAFKPSNPMWCRGSEFTVDETSLLPKYVNMSDLCEITDVYTTAPYLYELFTEVTKVIPITPMGSGNNPLSAYLDD